MTTAITVWAFYCAFCGQNGDAPKRVAMPGECHARYDDETGMELCCDREDAAICEECVSSLYRMVFRPDGGLAD